MLLDIFKYSDGDYIGGSILKFSQPEWRYYAYEAKGL
jgi:hypothetical protein